MTAPMVRAEGVAKLICEAMGISTDRTARIILDLKVNSAAAVYVQMYGSHNLLDIDWEAALKGANVIVVGEQKDLAARE